MKLNLGSYIYPLEGYVNVDIKAWMGGELIADLNKLPWPLASGQYEEVRAIDIFEHLGKLTKVEIIEEVARITRVGGRVHVRVPCATHPIALQSIQHAHVFYFDSFTRDYAQPYFECETRWVTILEGKYRFKFQSPFRPLFRLLGRMKLIYCLEFELRKV